MDICSSPFEEPYLTSQGVPALCFYLVFMFTTSSKNCSVTFHGIQFPREYFIIDISLVPLGHIRM